MITNLPPFIDMLVTDKGHRFSTEFQYYLDQTFQVMDEVVQLINTMLTVNSIHLAPLTTAQIIALAATANPGTIWYNGTTGKLNFLNSASTVEAVTSTP
jgi:hypothetical protein